MGVVGGMRLGENGGIRLCSDFIKFGLFNGIL